MMNWKEMEGNGRGQNLILSWHVPGGTEEHRDSLCSGRDLSLTPPQYEFKQLTPLCAELYILRNIGTGIHGVTSLKTAIFMCTS
jgi:hypothetical protein